MQSEAAGPSSRDSDSNGSKIMLTEDEEAWLNISEERQSRHSSRKTCLFQKDPRNPFHPGAGAHGVRCSVSPFNKMFRSCLNCPMDSSALRRDPGATRHEVDSSACSSADPGVTGAEGHSGASSPADPGDLHIDVSVNGTRVISFFIEPPNKEKGGHANRTQGFGMQMEEPKLDKRPSGVDWKGTQTRLGVKPEELKLNKRPSAEDSKGTQTCLGVKPEELKLNKQPIAVDSKGTQTCLGVKPEELKLNKRPSAVDSKGTQTCLGVKPEELKLNKRPSAEDSKGTQTCLGVKPEELKLNKQPVAVDSKGTQTCLGVKPEGQKLDKQPVAVDSKGIQTCLEVKPEELKLDKQPSAVESKGTNTSPGTKRLEDPASSKKSDPYTPVKLGSNQKPKQRIIFDLSPDRNEVPHIPIDTSIVKLEPRKWIYPVEDLRYVLDSRRGNKRTFFPMQVKQEADAKTNDSSQHTIGPIDTANPTHVGVVSAVAREAVDKSSLAEADSPCLVEPDIAHKRHCARPGPLSSRKNLTAEERSILSHVSRSPSPLPPSPRSRDPSPSDSIITLPCFCEQGKNIVMVDLVSDSD